MNTVKFNFESLSFELTRRCNLNCTHCFRGEPQDKNIDYNVIDRVFDETNYINILNCSGGEPLLNVEAIEYIVEQLIKRKINIRIFTMTTNGTILSEKTAEQLNKIGKYTLAFAKSKLKNTKLKYGANITISNDKYHHNNPDMAVQFYRQHCAEYVTVYKQGSEKIENEIDNADDGLVYSGRAKELQANNFFVCSPFHKIEFENGMVRDCIEIAVNGNSSIAAYQSFDEIDHHSMGNILNASFADMIKNWNFRYPLTYEENKQRQYSKFFLETNNEKEEKQKLFNILKYYNSMENFRIELHDKYPNLSPAEIFDISNSCRKLMLTENEEERKFLQGYILYAENINKERGFKGHEETHKKFPNLTPEECKAMDYSIEQIDADWSGYSDPKVVTECKERHKATAQALIEKNNSRNPFNEIGELFGLITKALQIFQK